MMGFHAALSNLIKDVHISDLAKVIPTSTATVGAYAVGFLMGMKIDIARDFLEEETAGRLN